jgi:hypothetical protein
MTWLNEDESWWGVWLSTLIYSHWHWTGSNFDELSTLILVWPVHEKWPNSNANLPFFERGLIEPVKVGRSGGHISKIYLILEN